jgi:4-amino-4-deoxy-L-arabinose transferase-like glycosyltransferase
VVWIALLSWIAWFNGLGNAGLLDETEPLFVEAARQMHLQGNWITPYFNGAPRFDKPPLIYWLMALGFRVFGVGEWAARLPCALAGTGLVAFLFYAVAWLGRWPTEDRKPSPWWSGATGVLPYLISATATLNLQMVFFGRIGYSDMLLNACFGSALLAFFLGYCQPEHPRRQWWWYLACFGLMGLAVLTKGPVGIVLPGLIMLLFVILSGHLRAVVRELPWGWGSLVLLLIALPWYGLATIENGWVFIQTFFGFHNLERFTQVVNQHSGPWYYHIAILAVGVFPWSIALPAAIGAVLTQHPPREQRPQHLGILALAWLVGVLGFFTIASTKYITYSLPAVPAAAILVGLWWQHHHQGRQPGWGLLVTAWVTVIAYVGLAIATWYSPNWLNQDPAMPNLGHALQAAGLPWVGAVIWASGALGGLWCLLQRQSRNLWRVNLLVMAVLILVFITPAFMVMDGVRQQPLRAIATAVQEERQPNETVMMAVNFFEKPSLVFYTGQRVEFVTRMVRLQATLETIRQQGQSSVLLVTTGDSLQEAGFDPTSYPVLYQAGIYRLVRLPLLSAPSTRLPQ